MGLLHMEDYLADAEPFNEPLWKSPDPLVNLIGPRDWTLEQFLLCANCQSCGRLIQKGEGYLIAGNPSVIWKFHPACFDSLPYNFRRGLDVYGGVKTVEEK